VGLRRELDAEVFERGGDPLHRLQPYAHGLRLPSFHIPDGIDADLGGVRELPLPHSGEGASGA
jgi:hypothetical protein